MNEDVRQSIEELEALYYKGNYTVDTFIGTYEDLLEDKFDRMFEPSWSLPSQLISENNAQQALDEYDAFEALNKEVDDFAEHWTKSINVILKTTPRFRLQFNDPSEIGYMYGNHAFKNIPPRAQAIEDKIDDLSSQVRVVRKIIIEMDRNAELVENTARKSIQPATYDKKTNTLSFAGKDIRFKKNAPFTPALCDVIFSQPDKLWLLKDLQKLWDSQYDYLPERITDWHRVYEAINRVNMRIYKQTDIDNLFVLSTTSVRLNQAYLSDAKKSQ